VEKNGGKGTVSSKYIDEIVVPILNKIETASNAGPSKIKETLPSIEESYKEVAAHIMRELISSDFESKDTFLQYF